MPKNIAKTGCISEVKTGKNVDAEKGSPKNYHLELAYSSYSSLLEIIFYCASEMLEHN